MGYIGQPLNHGNLAADVFSGDGSTTGFTLSYSVGSANSISIYIDGVKQAVSTYTASGTTLTFTTAPPSGTNNIEVIFLALEITLPTPGDNTVDETKLKDALIADFTEVVVTAADSILLGDATDSGNTKRDTVQGILDLVSGSDFMKGVATTYDVSTGSGNQDITGFGFDPTFLVGFGHIEGTDTTFMGWSEIGTLDRSVSERGDNGNSYLSGQFPSAIVSSGNSVLGVTSSITDGVRIAWTQAGSPTGTLQIMLLGFR